MEPTRILIVEDELIVAESIEKSLLKLGYQVCDSVPSGEEAVALAEKSRPDLVLMDITLKGEMDGIEAAEIIWATYRIPIVFLTAHADNATLKRAKMTGPIGYILKPFIDRDLHTAIEMGLCKHRAEEALRASETRFRMLAESSPVAIYETDAEGQCLYVNPKWCELSGLSLEEARGEGWSRSLHPDDRQEIFRKWNEHSKGILPWNFEYRFCTPKGRINWVWGSAVALRDAEGRITGYMGVNIDITERKRAEEALSESEKRFREIAETVNEVFWVGAADWSQVYYVSPAYERIWGRTVQSLYEQPLSWLDALHPEDREAARLDIDAKIHRRSVTPDFAPYRVMHPEGSTRWVFARAFPVLNPDGQIARIVGIAEDITARKQAEEALRESETRLRLALEAGTMGIWDWNILTGVIVWSAEHAQLFGLKPSEFDGRYETFATLVHADDLAGLEEEIRHSRDECRAYRHEFRVIWPDGSVHWLAGRGHFLRDANGEPVRMLGVISEITERKQLEIERQKFLLLAESSSEFIGMCDLDMNPVYVNPAGQRMVGLPDMAAACRVKVQDYYFPEDRRFIAEEFFPRVLREGHGEVEIRLRHFQTGEPIWMFANFFVVRDSSSQAIGWAIVSRNITERKQAEAEREKLQSQLIQAQKMESIGRLAGGVAHDFNNMLGAILGNVNLALGEVSQGSLLHECLGEIEKCAIRSADLTRQLLAFARKQTIAPKTLDLNDTVEGMLKMLRRLIGENINLVWLPTSELWTIEIDPSQIDQILTNLCVNARDAINGLGKITLVTANVMVDDTYTAEHPGLVPGYYVMLSVNDTGCGMDKEALSHLFEPFFTTKEIGKGTGLGLATVYGVVRQNGGYIAVSSEPTLGTTFKIYLPRHISKVDANPVKDSGGAHIKGHETILLVEDEPSLLRISRRSLEIYGYRVLAASTPGEAIQLAEKYAGQIHLLVTDVIMPEMNGRELARRLLTRYPNLKRLFISGYTADIIAPHGVLEDGTQFLQKPFTVEILANKVREIIGRTSSTHL